MRFLKFIHSGKVLLLLIIALLPLLVLHHRSDYQWEGDTAHMLFQAENILNGKAHYETYYVFNPNYPILSPAYYPIVTPLIFSIGMAITPNYVPALMLMISILYLVLTVLVFLLLKPKINPWIAALISVLLAYNQFLIRVKDELLSELPFALLLLAFVFLWKKRLPLNSIWKWIVLGILAALALHTRTMAYVLPLALVLFAGIQWIKNRRTLNWKDYIKPISFLLLSFLFVWIILNLLFPSPANGVIAYKNHFMSVSWMTSWENLNIYAQLIMDILISPMAGWGLFGQFIRYAALVFLIFGVVLKLKRNIALEDIIVGVYFFILLIYPYQQAPTRFLFPVFPLLIFYLIESVKFVSQYLQRPKLITSLFVLFFVAQILIAVKGNYYYTNYSQKPSDLSSKETKEMLEFVRNQVGEDELILSSYPRIISYYCRRYAYASDPMLGLNAYIADKEKFQPQYFLISKIYSPKQDLEFLQTIKAKKIFENKDYLLFRFC